VLQEAELSGQGIFDTLLWGACNRRLLFLLAHMRGVPLGSVSAWPYLQSCL
jgi:hypothetical protein